MVQGSQRVLNICKFNWFDFETKDNRTLQLMQPKAGSPKFADSIDQELIVLMVIFRYRI